MSDTPTSVVMDAMLRSIGNPSTDYWQMVTELTDTGPVLSVETPKGVDAFKLRTGDKNVYIEFPAELFDADFEVEPGGPEFHRGERVRRIRLSAHHVTTIAVRPDGTCLCRLRASRYLEDEGRRERARLLMLLAQARLLLKLGV
jgi:hypothetical protein